jgi:hypothetical protein
MMRAGWCSPLALAWLLGIGACDAGEIVVFSAPQAGSAGTSANAGSAGLVTVAGAGGSVGGSLDGPGGGGVATSGAGGGGGAVDDPCQNSNDCGPSWFCQKQNCSDPQGACVPRPVSDDPVRSAVCGCNHYTYFNDTLRKQAGIPAILTTGECSSGAKTCDSNDYCPDAPEPSIGRASCSRNVTKFGNCDMPGKGQCWVTPRDCAATTDKPHFVPCPPPGMPNLPPPCLTTCQAVQFGIPYFPSCM